MKRKSSIALSQIKSSLSSYFSQCKFRLVLFSAVVIICFIAGIVLFCTRPSIFPGDECILSYNGVKTGIGTFFARGGSIFVVLGVSALCSLSLFSLPIAILLIGFRGYLLAFNICSLCSKFGMSGMIDAILIIIPCQMVILALMTLFLAFFSKASSVCKKFGSKAASRGKMFGLFFLVMMVVNLVETVMLGIFSSSVILVI